MDEGKETRNEFIKVGGDPAELLELEEEGSHKNISCIPEA